MDITQRIQWKSKITKYCFPKKHQSTALSYKMYSCIIFLLTEGQTRILTYSHNAELLVEVRWPVRSPVQCLSWN